MLTHKLAVNGFELPATLAEVIASGSTGCAHWTKDNAISLWYSMFDAAEVDQPQIYPKDLLKKVNVGWTNENRATFLGTNDGISRPGHMAPKWSILFGELGQDAH